jgi:hypothetical protein
MPVNILIVECLKVAAQEATDAASSRDYHVELFRF